VCGCQPPGHLCDHGHKIVKLIRRESKLLNQFGHSEDAVDRRNAQLREWADHIYQDRFSAIAFLPPATV
jgi:hypothetical protein